MFHLRNPPFSRGFIQTIMMSMTTTKTQDYIDQLIAQGEISFTKQRMQSEMKMTARAAEKAIHALKERKRIASPARGYYLILTPEFRQLGCLPPDYFIDDLMQHWQQEYYIGLLTAALYFGAAHQQLQTFQVVVGKPRPAIHCGRVRIEFVTKSEMSRTPTQQLKTRTGYMTVATPEATIIDLIQFMNRCGGINHVATVLDELAESVDLKVLKELLTKKHERAGLQRLGFLLEFLGHEAISDVIYQCLTVKDLRVVPLAPEISATGAKRHAKWKIALNTTIESDLDDTY